MTYISYPTLYSNLIYAEEGLSEQLPSLPHAQIPKILHRRLTSVLLEELPQARRRKIDNFRQTTHRELTGHHPFHSVYHCHYSRIHGYEESSLEIDWNSQYPGRPQIPCNETHCYGTSSRSLWLCDLCSCNIRNLRQRTYCSLLAG